MCFPCCARENAKEDIDKKKKPYRPANTSLSSPAGSGNPRTELNDLPENPQSESEDSVKWQQEALDRYHSTHNLGVNVELVDDATDAPLAISPLTAQSDDHTLHIVSPRGADGNDLASPNTTGRVFEYLNPAMEKGNLSLLTKGATFAMFKSGLMSTRKIKAFVCLSQNMHHILQTIIEKKDGRGCFEGRKSKKKKKQKTEIKKRIASELIAVCPGTPNWVEANGGHGGNCLSLIWIDQTYWILWASSTAQQMDWVVAWRWLIKVMHHDEYIDIMKKEGLVDPNRPVVSRYGSSFRDSTTSGCDNDDEDEPISDSKFSSSSTSSSSSSSSSSTSSSTSTQSDARKMYLKTHRRSLSTNSILKPRSTPQSPAFLDISYSTKPKKMPSKQSHFDNCHASLKNKYFQSMRQVRAKSHRHEPLADDVLPADRHTLTLVYGEVFLRYENRKSKPQLIFLQVAKSDFKTLRWAFLTSASDPYVHHGRDLKWAGSVDASCLNGVTIGSSSDLFGLVRTPISLTFRESKGKDANNEVPSFHKWEMHLACDTFEQQTIWESSLRWLMEENSNVGRPFNVHKVSSLNVDLHWHGEDLFDIGDLIGTGAFCDVYEATHKITKIQMAVKIFNVDVDPELSSEIETLMALRNPGCVSYYGSVVDTKTGSLHLLLEYCDGGSMSDLIKQAKVSLKERHVAYILGCTLKALVHLHDSGVIHRDIKGSNILVTSRGEVKLSDFGIAASLSQEHEDVLIAGSPLWMAPEAWVGEGSFKTDIWALGITAIELATSVVPRHTITKFGELRNAITNLPSPTLPKSNKNRSWSSEFCDFVNSCLQKDPKKRPLAKELLQHPFIAKASDALKSGSPPNSFVKFIRHKSYKKKTSDKGWYRALANMFGNKKPKHEAKKLKRRKDDETTMGSPTASFPSFGSFGSSGRHSKTSLSGANISGASILGHAKHQRRRLMTLEDIRNRHAARRGKKGGVIGSSPSVYGSPVKKTLKPRKESMTELQLDSKLDSGFSLSATPSLTCSYLAPPEEDDDSMYTSFDKANEKKAPRKVVSIGTLQKNARTTLNVAAREMVHFTKRLARIKGKLNTSMHSGSDTDGGPTSPGFTPFVAPFVSPHSSGDYSFPSDSSSSSSCSSASMSSSSNVSLHKSKGSSPSPGRKLASIRDDEPDHVTVEDDLYLHKHKRRPSVRRRLKLQPSHDVPGFEGGRLSESEDLGNGEPLIRQASGCPDAAKAFNEHSESVYVPAEVTIDPANTGVTSKDVPSEECQVNHNEIQIVTVPAPGADGREETGKHPSLHIKTDEPISSEKSEDGAHHTTTAPSNNNLGLSVQIPQDDELLSPVPTDLSGRSLCLDFSIAGVSNFQEDSEPEDLIPTEAVSALEEEFDFDDDFNEKPSLDLNFSTQQEEFQPILLDDNMNPIVTKPSSSLAAPSNGFGLSLNINGNSSPIPIQTNSLSLTTSGDTWGSPSKSPSKSPSTWGSPALGGLSLSMQLANDKIEEFEPEMIVLDEHGKEATVTRADSVSSQWGSPSKVHSSNMDEMEIDPNQTYLIENGVFHEGGFSVSASGVDHNGAHVDDQHLHASDLVELATIGRGQNGRVLKALHLPSLSVIALKTMNVHDQSTRHQLVNELQVYCDHAHSDYVVSFFGAYFDHGEITLGLEYMDCGSLQHMVKMKKGKLSESLVRQITKQFCLGLDFLHSANRLHRDIKPENLLINHKGQVKLVDFGLTKTIDEGKTADTFLGTMTYLAPERISTDQYSFPSDVWAMGLTIIYAATGRHCLDSADYWTLVDQIKHAEPPSLDPHHFSPMLCDFVSKCLQMAPAKRATTKELLQHPYILGCPDLDDLPQPAKDEWKVDRFQDLLHVLEVIILQGDDHLDAASLRFLADQFLVSEETVIRTMQQIRSGQLVVADYVEGYSELSVRGLAQQDDWDDMLEAQEEKKKERSSEEVAKDTSSTVHGHLIPIIDLAAFQDEEETIKPLRTTIPTSNGSRDSFPSIEEERVGALPAFPRSVTHQASSPSTVADDGEEEYTRSKSTKNIVALQKRYHSRVMLEQAIEKDKEEPHREIEYKLNEEVGINMDKPPEFNRAASDFFVQLHTPEYEALSPRPSVAAQDAAHAQTIHHPTTPMHAGYDSDHEIDERGALVTKRLQQAK